MEELKSCSICGRLFHSDGHSSICSNCFEKAENEFSKIREYLYEHPRASIYEVATNLDITVSKIKHFLRDGRIEIVEKDSHFLECEICGLPIRSGRCCDECLKHSTHDYTSTYAGDSKVKGEHKINFLSKKGDTKRR